MAQSLSLLFEYLRVHRAMALCGSASWVLGAAFAASPPVDFIFEESTDEELAELFVPPLTGQPGGWRAAGVGPYGCLRDSAGWQCFICHSEPMPAPSGHQQSHRHLRRCLQHWNGRVEAHQPVAPRLALSDAAPAGASLLTAAPAALLALEDGSPEDAPPVEPPARRRRRVVPQPAVASPTSTSASPPVVAAAPPRAAPLASLPPWSRSATSSATTCGGGTSAAAAPAATSGTSAAAVEARRRRLEQLQVISTSTSGTSSTSSISSTSSTSTSD